jgi:hypothetical protein
MKLPRSYALDRRCRFWQRRREFAACVLLGANRLRLIRQRLIENVPLASFSIASIVPIWGAQTNVNRRRRLCLLRLRQSDFAAVVCARCASHAFAHFGKQTNEFY